MLFRSLVASVGLMGAVLANFVAKKFDWQIAYFIGGGLGLLLLVARVSIFESGIFLKVKLQGIQRGNFFQLFQTRARFKKFMGSIFIGLPIWFTIGILITFSPEFAKALHITGVVSAGDAVMYSYIGLAAGDLSSGLISQLIGSRKKVVLLYIFITLATVVLYLFSPGNSANYFYVTCFLLGVGIGYWALFVTIAAEQFGTNLRSTVATTVPNFIRGAVIPLTLAFKYFRELLGGDDSAVIYGALIVGICTVAIALIALQAIEETFGRDMNFLEE